MARRSRLRQTARDLIRLVTFTFVVFVVSYGVSTTLAPLPYERYGLPRPGQHILLTLSLIVGVLAWLRLHYAAGVLPADDRYRGDE